MSRRWAYSARSMAQLRTVHPALREVFLRALEHEACPYDITIVEGARTPERQRQLKADGFSWTLNSRHLVRDGDQHCHAVDVVPYVRGDVRWSRSEIDRLAVHVFAVAYDLGVPVVWGGHWSTYDGAHWELPWEVYP